MKAYYLDIGEETSLFIERWQNEKAFVFLIKKSKTEITKILQPFNDKCKFINWFQSFSYGNAKVLLNSSGNFDGADMLTFASQVTGNNI